MKAYHGKPYPILRKHKAVLMKEIEQLWDIGVLEWQQSLRWALPTFIIPKKDSPVFTISDFRELNKRIVRKPHPIPKISMMVQKIEGFTYVLPKLCIHCTVQSYFWYTRPRSDASPVIAEPNCWVRFWGGRLTTSSHQRKTAGPNVGLGIPI